MELDLHFKLLSLKNRAECVGMDPNYVFVQDGFTAIDDQYGVSDFEASQYFYHPDHLGSSSFITNASGNVDQHLQYLPFGEPWIDQRTQNNIRFTFSGKERDEETGYNYFGARYYNADISIWLSVDPLSDKFPSMTGYNYCFNNPIVLVDPDGMQPWWPGVTTTFIELKGSIGIGPGVNIVNQSGVVRDEVGKTHFISRSTVLIGPADHQVTYSALASIMGGIKQDWKHETFYGQLSSSGWGFQAGLAEGISIGLAFGDGYVSLSIGMGIGFDISVTSTEIVESISLTDFEANKLNKEAVGNGSWGVTNVTPNEDDLYKFKGNVTINSGNDKRKSEIEVYSFDRKTWMTAEYIKQSRKAEGL
jgi:RHS repeat-associated protein